MEKIKTKKVRLYKRHPIAFWGCILIEGLVIFLCIIDSVRYQEFISSLFESNLLAIPAILTFINIYLIFVKPKDEIKWKIKVRLFEISSATVGFILSARFLRIFAVNIDWQYPVRSGDMHSPIWTQSWPTVLTLCLIAVAGYMVLACNHAKKTPPLVTVLAISAVYIGVFECVLWGIQVIELLILPIILPINLIIIAARLIREKALELKVEGDLPYSKSRFIGWINHELASKRYPIWTLVMVFPLLGVAIGILALFGQRPDYIIKSYTETADWVLSTQIPPPSIHYDPHYLCTVAAQGHKKLVRPQRIGIRQGSKIIVNRQLCIANAFEQLLEELTPKFHKAVRGFYNTHGFPLSKLIKTKAAADGVYILMKPLEWMFLITLYLLTINPEERIARQYTL